MDHTVWNKYGAALANSNKTEQAKQAYQQAIELRPNYVRTLVNIGLAHNNNQDFMTATKYFLDALMLNPQAKHLWSYTRQSLLQADNFELLELLERKDPSLFRGTFDLLDP